MILITRGGSGVPPPSRLEMKGFLWSLIRKILHPHPSGSISFFYCCMLDGRDKLRRQRSVVSNRVIKCGQWWIGIIPQKWLMRIIFSYMTNYPFSCSSESRGLSIALSQWILAQSCFNLSSPSTSLRMTCPANWIAIGTATVCQIQLVQNIIIMLLSSNSNYSIRCLPASLPALVGFCPNLLSASQSDWGRNNNRIICVPKYIINSIAE